MRYSYSPSLELWNKSKELGLQTMLFYFQRLKYRNNYNPVNKKLNPFQDTEKNKEWFSEQRKYIFADKTGGFIKRKDLQKIARQINSKDNTLRIMLGKMAKEGWVERTQTGWRMVSMREIAENLDVELRRLKIKAKTLSEVKTKIAYLTIRKTQRRTDKVTQKQYGTMSANLSGKTLANMIGCKSASTAIKREKELEKQGLLQVIRHPVMRTKIVNEVGITKVEYKKPCNQLRTFSFKCR